MNIGKRLRKLRIEHNLTQNEVSIFRQLYMVVVIPVIMIISFFFGAKYRNRKN